METTNLKNAIQIQNSEDFKKLDLTKFSSKQTFGYNCTVCGEYYERKLYRLQQFDFELLCSNCSSQKHRKPQTEDQKKATLEKKKQTMLARYGVEHSFQSSEIQAKARQTNLKKYGVEHPTQSKEVKEKVKQTNLSRYGVEHNWQIEEVREKIKQTMLARYGAEHALQSEKIQEKMKRMNLERYGAENASQSEEVKAKKKQTCLKRYGVDNPRKSEKIKERVKQTNLAKYGVDNPRKSKEIKEKIKQTNLQRYGVETPFQSSEIQTKIKQTNLERYGVEHALQSEKIQEKMKQTNLERYGVEYFTQSKEMQSKRKQAYGYENLSFDSKPELAFYIYCKDRGTRIERNNQKFFTYELGGKTHRYFPDFVVNGELIEIKGSHFLKESNTWQNPFDHSQDTTYEAKHQCALRNGVKILYGEDYQKCIDYVLEAYGKDFFESCKTGQNPRVSKHFKELNLSET